MGTQCKFKHFPFRNMASKAKYHLLPEEAGRPSIDTIDDEQPLINASRRSSLAPPPPKEALGFHSFHITLYLRILSFIFNLAAAIVLGLVVRDQDVIPTVVFLTLALARNFYVVFVHLLSMCLSVDLSLRINGKKVGWSKERLVPLIIDITLLVCLIIVIPIGISNQGYWSRHQEQTGYALAFTGFPFYLLSVIDCGRPSSVAVVALFDFKFDFNGKKDTGPARAEMAYSDVEAQLPGTAEEEDGPEGTIVI